MRACAYKGKGGQKIGHNMHTRTKWMTPNSSFEKHTRISILKLFNVVAIYASKFFPFNIEQCSLLGFSCVLADSTVPF